MFNLAIRTWILNAAAVFSGRHGAVTRQAEQAGCSRQTVYQHAYKLERRLAEPDPEAVDCLRAENQRLHPACSACRVTAPWRPEKTAAALRIQVRTGSLNMNRSK